MAQGVPTEESVIAEFRARYLYSGNASAVGRDLGLEERTARKIAERLEADPSFAEDGRKVRDRALHKHVAMRLSMCEVASDRFHSETGGIETKSFGGEDNQTVVITDKRWEYGKLVIDAEKNAHNLARFDAEKDGAVSRSGEVTIRIAPTPEAAVKLAEDVGSDPG